MYHSRVVAYLFVALMALMATTSAYGPRGHFERRQDASATDDVSSSSPTSAAPSTTPTSSADPVTTSNEPSTVPTSTAIDSTSSPPTSIAPSTTDAPTTTAGSTSQSSGAVVSSPQSTPSSTSTVSSSRPSDSVVVSSSIVTLQTSTVPATTVVFVVTSGSKTYSQTSTVLTTATSTPTGAVASSGDSASPSGVTDPQKKIIIGVVVGVGGALLLGGLAVVAWRLWGKRRNAGEENDILMGGPGAGHEKTSSVDNNSPFKSTLDQYHTPAGRLNTASNF